MLRLKAIRAKRALRDPRHAFKRLYDNLSVLRAAKDTAKRNLLGGLSAERGTSSLRSVYGSFKQHGLRAMSNTGLSTATPPGDALQHRRQENSAGVHEKSLQEASVTGHDGVMRVYSHPLLTLAFLRSICTSADKLPFGNVVIKFSQHSLCSPSFHLAMRLEFTQR